MQAHGAGCGLDLGGIHLAKAGDVLSHRALEQLHTLGQIAHAGAQLGFVPGEHIHTIQTHLAHGCRPQPGQQTRQRRLARGRGADHRQHLTRRQRKRYAFEDVASLCAGRTGHQLLDLHSAARCGQSHVLGALGDGGQQVIEARPSVAHIDHGLPLGHHLHQRRQHAPAQYRCNDHHPVATIEAVVQQQPAAQAQQQRTQGGLQQFGDGLVATGSLRGLGLQVQKLTLLVHPAGMNVAQHAHGLDDLGVAQRAVGVLLGGDGAAVGLHQRGLGATLVEPAHHRQHQGKHQRHPAQHRADQKQQHRAHQRHGHLHHGQQRGRRQKIAHLPKIVQRLLRAAGNAAQVGLENRLKNTSGQLRIQGIASGAHQFATGPLQHFHEHIHAQHQQGQHDQRGMAAAVDYAAIDFQHVASGRQHQQAGEQAEPASADKIRA